MRLFNLESILTVAVIALLVGISHVLLQRKSFRLHGILLLLFALGTVVVLFSAGEDSPYHASILFFALFYLAVDHYWARRNAGEKVVPLQTVRKCKIVFAAIFTLWTVLAYMELPFFSHFQRTSLLCIAALLWLDTGFQKIDPQRGPPSSPD